MSTYKDGSSDYVPGESNDRAVGKPAGDPAAPPPAAADPQPPQQQQQDPPPPAPEA